MSQGTGSAAHDSRCVRWARGLAPAMAPLACVAVGCGMLTGSYEIGGHVRLRDGAPVEGVEVVVTWPETSGSKKPLTTDAQGWYSWEWGTSLLGYDEGALAHVVITPEAPGMRFEPPAYDLELDGDRLDLDFTATPLEAAPGGGSVMLWVVLSGPGSRAPLSPEEWRGVVGTLGVRARWIDVRPGPPAGASSGR